MHTCIAEHKKAHPRDSQVGFYVFGGEGGWIYERHLCLPGIPPLLILPDNASRKEVLAILAEKLDGKET